MTPETLINAAVLGYMYLVSRSRILLNSPITAKILAQFNQNRGSDAQFRYQESKQSVG